MKSILLPAEIGSHYDTILSYLEEAIQNQKEGKVIKADKNKPIDIPVELKHAVRILP